jgi:hypothetical protein
MSTIDTSGLAKADIAAKAASIRMLRSLDRAEHAMGPAELRLAAAVDRLNEGLLGIKEEPNGNL